MLSGMGTVTHFTVLCGTAAVHVCLSTVISPHLLRPSEGRRLKSHVRYQVLGYLVHSVVVAGLATFSFLKHDSETFPESWAAILAVNISLSFFITDLLTTVTKLPSGLLQDKGDLLHHVCAIGGLLATVCYGDYWIELSVNKLLSQLSVPFLILRLILLDRGQSDTLIYLVVFSAMILVHFLSRIAVIPWFWITFLSAMPVLSTEVIVIGALSLIIDLLNIYWLKQMMGTYFKYYPEKYNVMLKLRHNGYFLPNNG